MRELKALPPSFYEPPGPSEIGFRIHGIRYQEFINSRGTFRIPVLPQTEEEREITEQFLKEQRCLYSRWRQYVCAVRTDIMSDPDGFEFGRVVIFNGGHVELPSSPAPEQAAPVDAVEQARRRLAASLRSSSDPRDWSRTRAGVR
jgi:hypothetical protein